MLGALSLLPRSLAWTRRQDQGTHGLCCPGRRDWAGWASSDLALARWEPTGGFELRLPGQFGFQKTTLGGGGGRRSGRCWELWREVSRVVKQAGCTQRRTEGRGYGAGGHC